MNSCYPLVEFIFSKIFFVPIKVVTAGCFIALSYVALSLSLSVCIWDFNWYLIITLILLLQTHGVFSVVKSSHSQWVIGLFMPVWSRTTTTTIKLFFLSISLSTHITLPLDETRRDETCLLLLVTLTLPGLLPTPPPPLSTHSFAQTSLTISSMWFYLSLLVPLSFHLFSFLCTTQSLYYLNKDNNQTGA